MKVLIVDDEMLICESLRADFARMRHPWPYEVFTAQSVSEAEEIYYREEPDILITDINMPKGSGLLLVSEVRRVNTRCRILILSAYDDFEYVRNAFVMGADDYILKPIAFSELEKHVLEMAEKLEPGAAEKKEADVFSMEDVLRYISEHVGEKSGAAEMAKKMAVSYSGFGKQFRDYTGMSFSAYILSCRMERAKEYLKNPHIKIKQVASKVGYREDPQHFSRDFMKQTGMSPREYRMRVLREKGTDPAG